MATGPKRAAPARREVEDPRRLWNAIDRLARVRAFYTLVRGALPLPILKRLLKNALPKNQAREMPTEVWASLASSIAIEEDDFATELGRILDERLGRDKEPVDLDGWWQAVRERPLEALWMAGLSDSKPVRKEFAHIVEHCLENWRQSPECTPPSWEYVEALLDVQAASARDLRDAEKKAEDAERKQGADRERLEELREELKRVRRENAELRGEKAEAERRAQKAGASAPSPEQGRLDDLERRLRKAEKENEHLRREIERLEPTPASVATPEPAASEDAVPEPPEPSDNSIATDLNARRRVIRQMLRKLVKKGKIGAAHTHEDNVYRGVADHEKGIAKEAIDLLYREGFLMPKPTATDPHVSIAPERMAEVRAMIAGRVENPRLLRFLDA